jgi:phage-related protein
VGEIRNPTGFAEAARNEPFLLHRFIKKTRATPDDDLALARKRKKELER